MKITKSIHNFRKQSFNRVRSSQKGFSLVELMVAVGIISILAAIGVPGIMNNLPALRLRTAARELYADMQRAKMLAVKTNREVSMTFFDADNSTANCPTGSYTFRYADDNSTISSITMQNDVCLFNSTFTAGDGFDTDGTPRGNWGRVTLKHLDAISTYTISQSVAGGITIDN